MIRQERFTPEREPARILIVDDHPVLRDGLAQLINRQPGLKVCGVAESAGQALGLIQSLTPDLAIVDISLRDSDGIELMKELRSRFPQLWVLALSIHDETFFAERALRAGARGYVMKQEPTDKIMKAIRSVLNGEIYVSEKISTRMLHQVVNGSRDTCSSPLERLSDRELQVFRLIGRGYGTREIAQELRLSVKTIETYRAHIMEKLELRGASELVKCAVQSTRSVV